MPNRATPGPRVTPDDRRPLVSLCLFLTLLVLGLGGPPVAQADEGKNAEESLYYTIQIGSFSQQDEALEWYNRLAKRLPAELKRHLRIEAIPPFHTVRLGKEKDRPGIISFLEEAQKVTKKTPAIIHGYYRTERIEKLYDPAAAPQTQEVVADLTKHLPPGEESLTTPANAKETPPPERPEEPLDTPTDSKPTGKTKAGRRESPAPPAKAVTTPPDAELKKALIAKYLKSQAPDPKAIEALNKQSQAFPASPACVSGECHAAIKAFSQPHEPSKNDRCTACHKQINDKHPEASTVDFELLASGAELCNRCHPKLQGKKTPHQPAAKGECLQCHAPHGSEAPFLLVGEANSQEKLCLKCHAEQVAPQKFTHGPVGLGACTYCHNPHESDHQFLLKEEPQALCTACHSDIAKGLEESTSVHSVVKNEGCVTCHQPHGSEFPSLLKKAGEEFCFTCHPDIDEKVKKSKSKHAGLYLDKGCGTCHQPHFSSSERLLNNKEIDLCLTCHSEKNAISSKSPKDIAIELKKTFLHGPVAQGQCSVCHDPHGSKFDKLLKGTYPESIYASYDPEVYGLCFSCHDQELLTKESGKATDFRNGSQNLHYLHAAIPRKGRTCRACHQPHSSNGPKLINPTGSFFGEWQMSISFETTGSGGSCMPGCHRKMEYSRDKAVSNSGKDVDFGTYHVEYESVK